MRALFLQLTFAIAFLASCAANTPTVTQDERPTGKEAFLYGRFYIETKSDKIALDGHQTMGLVIQCGSQDIYTFGVSSDRALQVIKIAPSTCSLTEFVYVDANGKVRLRERAPAKLMQDVRFDAGKAYYLGDFYVEPSTAGANKKTSNVWEIKTIRNEFSSTSAVLKSVYPNLAKLPTENRMIGR